MIDINVTARTDKETSIQDLIEHVKNLEASDAVQLALREAEYRQKLEARLRELHKLHDKGVQLMVSGAADYIREHFE